MYARLKYARTDDVMAFGLHEYLTDFLERISHLGEEVSRVVLAPPARIAQVQDE
jgi:hypothetical protein